MVPKNLQILDSYKKMGLKFTAPINTHGIQVEIGANKILGKLYIEEDGYWVFNPNKELNGYWNESSLGVVIEKLKELNKPLEEKFAEDFKKNL